VESGRSFTVIEADGGITDEGAEVESDSATVTFRLDRAADFEDGDNEYIIEVIRDANAYSAPAEGRENLAIGRSLDGLRFVADADPEGEVGDFLASLDALDTDGYNAALRQVSPARLVASDALVVDAARAFTSNQAAYLSARRAGFDRGFIQPIAPLPKPGSMASLQPSSVVLAQAIDEADGAAEGDQPLTPGRRLAGPRAGEDPEAARHGAYFRIYGLSNQQDTTPNRTGFDAETFGGQVGYHYDLSDDFLLGVAVSYGNTSADYDDDLGTLDSNSVRIGPYASWSFDRLYVDASLTFAYHLFDAERAIPDLELTAESDYDGYELTGYLGTGYSFFLDHGVTLTPMASIQYSYFDIESFTESGAGGANLAVDGRSTDSLRTRLGLDVSVQTPLDLIPYAFAGWEHEFFDEDESLSAAFVNGGPPFVVDFGSPGADRFFFGVGVNFLIEPGLIAYAHFENSVFDDGDIYAIAGGMRFNF
jgi:outer membrane autotransporter protein